MTQSTAHAHPSHPPSSAHPHRRTPSFNPPKVKSARPTLHRRSTTHHSILKLGSGQPKQQSVVHENSHSEMAASFLNFCAMCERQITVPDNSLLYCSESCRRKDSCKPLSASCPTTSLSLPTTPPASPPMSPRTIVPPMTPTRLPPMTPTRLPPSSAIRIPGDHHETKTDLDPTEWKPVIPAGSGPGNLSTLASSEAWQFLSQFHNEPMLPMCRHPGSANRNSTSSLSGLSAPGAVPVLTHTPSSVASSFSSNASDYAGSIHEAAHHRPLPPRHSSTSVTKGVELVVPHVKAPAEDATAADLSDHGSIFPASSSQLWEDDSKTPTA